MPAEQPKECEFCRYPTAALRDFTEAGRTWWLCHLCYATPAGSVAIYPTVHSLEHRQALQTVCYVGNTVLAALNGLHTRA